MINRLTTDTYQAQEVCAAARQHTQMNRERQPEGGVPENSINPDFVNNPMPDVAQEAINRNISSKTQNDNQEYGRDYKANASSDMF